MSKRISAPAKQALIARYHAGESATALCLQAGVPRSTFYSWLKPKAVTSGAQAISYSDHAKLKKHATRLEQIIEVLKKVGCTANASTQDRLRELEKLYGQYSVHVLCDALDVPRGTFYNHVLRNKRNNTTYQARRDELSEHIRQVFDESRQIYGAKKITAVLAARGIATSPKMVAELMGDMNLTSVRQGAKKLYKQFVRPGKKDELKLDFTAKAPNEVWVSDTTYYKFRGKFYFICAIIDLYSRKVVAHRVSCKHSSQLITGAFKLAYVNRSPKPGLIFHSDRGTPYTAYAFQSLLYTCGVTPSFSPSGKPTHNAVMESFFASLKREELYRSNYRSVQEFKRGLERYMEFYNTERLHSTLSYKTPNDYEAMSATKTPA